MLSIASCGPITRSGSYAITADLSGPRTCVTIANASAVRIDCQGHSIAGVSADRVNDLSVSNCRVTASPVTPFGFLGSFLKNVTVDHSTLPSSLFISDSEGVSINDNDLSDVGLIKVSFAVVSNNRFAKSTNPAAPIVAQDGSHNHIVNNSVDGGWNGAPVPNPPPANSLELFGTDDGIVLTNEANDVVQGNTIRNVWDVGIEGIGSLTDTSITNNTIVHAPGGIGAWHGMNWNRNTVSGNSVSHANFLFAFFFSPRPFVNPSNTCALRDSRFTANRFFAADATVTGIWVPSSARPSASFSFTDPACQVANNVIQGNDFGTQTAGPFFAPLSGFINGGGNICGRGSNLGC